MNKEIQVLYTIFQLELNPPFDLKGHPYSNNLLCIYDKFSTHIGLYYKGYNRFSALHPKGTLILNRIKQTFNVDKLTHDDVYHIVKHLYNWSQGKLSEEINEVVIQISDTHQFFKYSVK